ncbi:MULTISPECIES: NAD(P)H-dependent oxidoreductase [unclassified Rhizobium]|uniref:NADPH-dependent FMN reductase n=1 Tax=Rhizobium TaxID=379 RepID=UPI00084C52CC|nr:MULTISPECIES: NAD(P)H-dependent oxidoreductase [unclassified Rhizobium]OEC97372.1 FMN reductase [Rhizobium sp. YK2]QYA14001.1 NAD(P)H-dependent oxidoreductase [Rhizobium sp. AB2/73]UEQ80068.1 NAD(P)H-dependent oxidoreductase [Rhizobium sp. AB2/73]
MTERTRLAIIYGSTRPGRLCDRVVNWVARELAHYPLIDIDLIDPLEFDLPFAHNREHPGVAALSERLSDADAFIAVTPEYNHSFTASLKFVLDLVYEPWHGKPVAFVSYGGVSGGLRAVEQLRLVFAELHTVTVRDTVSFANPWGRFAEDGTLEDPLDARKSLVLMIARLTWWSNALKPARATRPYRSAAA